MAEIRKSYDERTEYDILRKIDYNPSTGVFKWKHVQPERLGDNYYNTRYAGKVAGVTQKTGYVYICINYKYIRAHRLAWFIVQKEWPATEVDHINHIRDDNRIENLRLATRSVQMRNRYKNRNNTSGVNGVRWHKGNNKWYVDIRLDGKVKYLGSFVDFDEAVLVRKNAEKEYGYSKSHGSDQ